jgi:hypothetical protein
MSATLIAKAKEVRDDNERGKGDHYHHGDREEAYTFTTIEQLLELGLIERAEDGMVSVPFESIEIRFPLAQSA